MYPAEYGVFAEIGCGKHGCQEELAKPFYHAQIKLSVLIIRMGTYLKAAAFVGEILHGDKKYFRKGQLKAVI